MEYWTAVRRELGRVNTHIDHSQKNTRHPLQSDIITLQHRYGPFYTMRFIYLNYYYRYHTQDCSETMDAQRVWLYDMYLWQRAEYELRVCKIGETLVQRNSGVLQPNSAPYPTNDIRTPSYDPEVPPTWNTYPGVWSGGVYDMFNPTLMAPRQAVAAINTPDTSALARRLFHYDAVSSPLSDDYTADNSADEDKNRIWAYVWSIFLDYESTYDKGATSEEIAPAFNAPNSAVHARYFTAMS